MLPSFLTYLKHPLKLSADAKILLAVSGGVDSMVMLDMFRHSALQFSVAHCNFQLRGQDSDQDQKLVEEYCYKHGITCFSKKFDTKTEAESSNESIQMIARKLRFQWFEELMTFHSFDFLATAHHAEDSLETALLNLSRGTGINGLKGILPISGQKIRPLLPFTKAEIVAYAHKNDIVWREDSSNASTKYYRNKLRHLVLPILEELNPGIYRTFLDTSEQVGDAWMFIERQLTIFKSNHSYQKGFHFQRGILNHEDEIFLLKTLLAQNGFSKDQISKLNAENPPAIGAVFYTQNWQLSCSADGYYLLPYSASEAENELKIDFSEQIIETSMGSLSIIHQTSIPAKTELMEAKNAFFDTSKLQFPLTLRKWRKGDKFIPFGMTGQKLISDYLIDIKMPINLKKEQLVLCSSDTIIWLVGQRIATGYGLEKNTKNIFYLSLSTL